LLIIETGLRTIFCGQKSQGRPRDKSANKKSLNHYSESLTELLSLLLPQPIPHSLLFAIVRKSLIYIYKQDFAFMRVRSYIPTFTTFSGTL